MALLPFGEDHIIRGMAYAADLFAGTVNSDVVNMKNHHHAMFIINVELGSTGTSVITMQACDDVVPTNTAAIPFYVQKYLGALDVPEAPVAVAADGFTLTAEAGAQIYVIMVDAAQLGSSGYSYLRLHGVEGVNDPIAASVLIALCGSRYKDAIPASAIV